MVCEKFQNFEAFIEAYSQLSDQEINCQHIKAHDRPCLHLHPFSNDVIKHLTAKLEESGRTAVVDQSTKEASVLKVFDLECFSLQTHINVTFKRKNTLPRI